MRRHLPSALATARTGGSGRVRCAVAVLLIALNSFGSAQTSLQTLSVPVIESHDAERSVNEWLLRMHEASRKRAYSGTFVVSAGGLLSSARIWHVCDGQQQMERVESLTGAPRSTFRRNDQVITFMPDTRILVAEKRESLGLFPNMLHSGDSSIARFYRVKAQGHERVAGFDADVVELLPQDRWRFGYRVWNEKKTGLVVKLQTLHSDGQVLEQASFSELQLDSPVSMTLLGQMMGNTKGYQVIKPELIKTSAAEQGWVLKNKIPGFNVMSCYQRSVAAVHGASQESTLQWIFSDGLATVSLFIESFDPRRHAQPSRTALGATHTLTRRLGDWWLTVVGEVPPETLAAFAQELERKK